MYQFRAGSKGVSSVDISQRYSLDFENSLYRDLRERILEVPGTTREDQAGSTKIKSWKMGGRARSCSLCKQLIKILILCEKRNWERVLKQGSTVV